MSVAAKRILASAAVLAATAGVILLPSAGLSRRLVAVYFGFWAAPVVLLSGLQLVFELIGAPRSRTARRFLLETTHLPTVGCALGFIPMLVADAVVPGALLIGTGFLCGVWLSGWRWRRGGLLPGLAPPALALLLLNAAAAMWAFGLAVPSLRGQFV